MDIIDTLTTREYNVKDKRLVVDVKMWVQFLCPDEEIISGDANAKKQRKKQLAGEIVTKTIENAYKACHNEGVDILGIKTGFYRRVGSDVLVYLGEDYLMSDMVDVRVTLIVK